MTTKRTSPVCRDLPETLAAWSLVLADDVHLRVGNGPTAVGKPQALAELAGLLDQLTGLGVGYREVLRVGETLVVETTLQLAPGDTLDAVPCVLIARSERGLITDMRFYLDRSSAQPNKAAFH